MPATLDFQESPSLTILSPTSISTLPCSAKADQERSSSPLSSPPIAMRWHAMDGLRCLAMFLVVALHSALAYVTIRVPGLLWGVEDQSTQFGLDLFFWWAVAVSMPIFFTLSGLFASKMLSERGLTGFAQDRVKRILIPMFAATLLVLPPTLLAWDYGFFVSERCTANEFYTLQFSNLEIDDYLVGPGHLWFLYHLFWALVFFGLMAEILQNRPRLRSKLHQIQNQLDQVFLSRWRIVILAIPTALIMTIGHYRNDLDTVMGMHNILIIDPARFLHHLWFFLVGVGLYSTVKKRGLDWLGQDSLFYLTLSIPCFIVRAWLLTYDFKAPLGGFWLALSEASGALFAWSSLFGMVGLFQRWLNRRSTTIRYLADSSYWIYLIHFPIVGLIQGDLCGLSLNAEIKFLLVFLITMMLGLGSYHVGVRYTRIGEYLHGSRVKSANSS